ncbi:MAG: SWIM zinc finger family protein, partial [Acidimicrobiales bacterium]
MLTQADQMSLRRLVGATTFTRGRVYAHRGAVTRCEWEDTGCQVVGDVQGTGSGPYHASVTLVRSPSERLSALRADCTCPVGRNCKHAVALLLAPGAGSHARDGAEPARPPQTQPLRQKRSTAAAWERPLQAVLADHHTDVGQGETGQIGLQFELVPHRPAPGARTR